MDAVLLPVIHPRFQVSLVAHIQERHNDATHQLLKFEKDHLVLHLTSMGTPERSKAPGFSEKDSFVEGFVAMLNNVRIVAIRPLWRRQPE